MKSSFPLLAIHSYRQIALSVLLRTVKRMIIEPEEYADVFQRVSTTNKYVCPVYHWKYATKATLKSLSKSVSEWTSPKELKRRPKLECSLLTMSTLDNPRSFWKKICSSPVFNWESFFYETSWRVSNYKKLNAYWEEQEKHSWRGIESWWWFMRKLYVIILYCIKLCFFLQQNYAHN